jgi:hypothetical protein
VIACLNPLAPACVGMTHEGQEPIRLPKETGGLLEVIAGEARA